MSDQALLPGESAGPPKASALARLRLVAALASKATFWPLWTASVILPLLALIGGARWSWDLVEAEAYARVTRTVGMLHEHALRAFETQDALLSGVQRFTEAMTWEEIAGSRRVAEFLSSLDTSTPATNALGMAAPGGRAVQSSAVPFPPPPTDVSDRDYFRAQQGVGAGRHVGEPILTQKDGTPVFSYSVPRLGADGRPDGGVLWVTSRLSTFADFWRSVLEGDNDVVALVRDDGAVLVRYPPLSPPTGQHIPPIGGQMDAAHAAAIKQPGTVARIEAASPFDGEIRTYFARRLPGLPVTILYGLHPAGPRDIWLHQVRVIATVTAVSAAVLLWLTWLASERARRENLAQARARMEAERRAGAEAALRKGQRLEVLGQLAAGVAHDFRNVVQAVQCGITLARNAAAAGDRAKADAVLTMAFDAAGRGAALTERMLDVAGRRPDGLETPAVADPVATVNATAGLLEQTMGRRFQVQVVAPVGGGRCPASVRGTQAELEAALLNLAVNARDAMPDGGSLCIAVSRDEVTGDQAHPAGLSPGHYAGITVADTGVGMDAATLRRATEAFFTTKPPGQGTGLGLASVRAFVEGVGGGLQLESPGPGRGTTVKMWLPESATSVDGKRQLTPAR